MSTTVSTNMSSLADSTVTKFCDALGSKQPTPGGGASAAIVAAVGAATAQMSAAYTQRKKDEESGAAHEARMLIGAMDFPALLKMADDDESAYQNLQKTWKRDCEFTKEQIAEIQSTALRVPAVLVEACHTRVVAVNNFLEHCNPNITSDAKVGIHQLAGAARSAYQTVLVNAPPQEEKDRLLGLLLEIQQIETELLK